MEIVKINEFQGKVIKARARALELKEEWEKIMKANTVYQEYQKALLQVADEEKREEEYKQSIINQMLDMGITELVKDGVKLKLANTERDKVEIVDESLIDERYFRVKKEVDKIALMKEYKECGVIEKGIDIVKNDSWKLTVKSV